LAKEVMITIARSWDIPQKGKDGKPYPPIRETVTIQLKAEQGEISRTYIDMNEAFFNMRMEHFASIRNRGNASSGGQRDYTGDFE